MSTEYPLKSGLVLVEQSSKCMLFDEDMRLLVRDLSGEDLIVLAGELLKVASYLDGDLSKMSLLDRYTKTEILRVM